MEKIRVKGVYRCNSRGRSYLFLSPKESPDWRVISLKCNLSIPNGQYVNLEGTWQNQKYLNVDKAHLHNFPYRRWQKDKKSKKKPAHL